MRNRHDDSVDPVLDDLLAEYAQIEPPPGLEDRLVTAILASRAKRRSRLRAAAFATAAAISALLIGFGLLPAPQSSEVPPVLATTASEGRLPLIPHLNMDSALQSPSLDGESVYAVEHSEQMNDPHPAPSPEPVRRIDEPPAPLEVLLDESFLSQPEMPNLSPPIATSILGPTGLRPVYPPDNKVEAYLEPVAFQQSGEEEDSLIADMALDDLAIGRIGLSSLSSPEAETEESVQELDGERQ